MPALGAPGGDERQHLALARAQDRGVTLRGGARQPRAVAHAVDPLDDDQVPVGGQVARGRVARGDLVPAGGDQQQRAGGRRAGLEAVPAPGQRAAPAARDEVVEAVQPELLARRAEQRAAAALPSRHQRALLVSSTGCRVLSRTLRTASPGRWRSNAIASTSVSASQASARASPPAIRESRARSAWAWGASARDELALPAGSSAVLAVAPWLGRRAGEGTGLRQRVDRALCPQRLQPGALRVGRDHRHADPRPPPPVPDPGGNPERSSHCRSMVERA